jgi:hypothetical protein
MKKLIAIMLASSLIILPFAVYGQSEQTGSNIPPISQSLVPEGDFALRLVPALKLGTPTSEAQAEDILTSVGIVPKNGWIADYPMTPILIGELQNDVVAAAEAHNLPMGKDEALKAFQDVAEEFSLAVIPGSQGQYAEAQPQSYTNPTVINNYYYEEGPPIITYYPPPWDYYYLYAWVPYPFWWGGFYFSGFFCLHDFHRVVLVGHHHHLISNHFIDPKTHAVFTVDPTTRTFGRIVRTPSLRTGRFSSSVSKKGATSIFNRSLERSRLPNVTTPTGKGSSNGNIGSQGYRGQHQGKVFVNPGNNTQNFTGRSNTWSTNPGRSFSAPSKSFSGSPSMGSRGSFGGFHAGGGHSFGGFSGGHGGCKGRC